MQRGVRKLREAAHEVATDSLLARALQQCCHRRNRKYGVPEYWVVDLVANLLWRHCTPGSTAYSERTEVAAGTLKLPAKLGEIAIAELF